MLSGTYYVRQVIYFVQTTQSPQGTVGGAINTYGNITFDGNGNFTFSGTFLDPSISNVGTQFTSSGTYVISASGMGYMTEINNQEGFSSSDLIVGMVSPKGIFIGSSTQNADGFNDLVIAAPVGSTQATNATLSGSYQVAYMDPTFAGDAIFNMTADGKGNIGTVNVTGYVGTNDASTETLTGVTYAFTNGAAQLMLGGDTNNSLVAGTSLLYISPDGNFVFGGSANGFDMFVGVLNATSDPSNYDALYYQAGLDFDLTQAASSGFAYLDSYYGAISAFSGNMIGHQSLNLQVGYGGAADNTYYDSYMLNGDGSSSDIDFAQNYWSSADGTMRIGYGASAGFLSLNVALQAPTLSGSGVFLNPQGVVNAASSAPFTAHISPGEFLTLYGSGLAPSAAGAPSLPLPTKLNGVQVMINGIAAPINFVSATQISVVVPFFTTQSTAQIKVINNGKSSNTVSMFVGTTSGGVFTFDPEGGIGNAAAQDITAGYALVSGSSPAQIGDTVAVYLAGLGAVNPALTNDGDPGASSPPYNETPQLPLVLINDSASVQTQATVSFAGLAPGYAGLYQINFTVPSGVALGGTTLEIVGVDSSGATDSDTYEAAFQVGTPAAASVSPAARAKPAGQKPLIHRHRMARAGVVTTNRSRASQPMLRVPLDR
jgi:uncharacterized protein (TIGR03437 family)